MDWAVIVPSLAIGGFFGWLVGVVLGHGETQQQMEKQERRLHALLAHIHESQMDRLEEVDLLMVAINEPDKGDWTWRAWKELRARQREERSSDESGFYAEMNRH